jgi:hypothetical protein
LRLNNSLVVGEFSEEFKDSPFSFVFAVRTALGIVEVVVR